MSDKVVEVCDYELTLDGSTETGLTYFMVKGYPIVNNLMASPRTTVDMPDRYYELGLALYEKHGWRTTAQACLYIDIITDCQKGKETEMTEE
jgi:hypothetical protein